MHARRWLLAPPLLAVLLITGPFRSAGDGTPWAALTIGALTILAAAWSVAVHGRPAPHGPVDVLGTVALSRRARLHVVGFEGRVLLVAEGAGGVRLLADAARSTHARTPEPVVTIPRPRATPVDEPVPADAARAARFRALALAERR